MTWTTNPSNRTQSVHYGARKLGDLAKIVTGKIDANRAVRDGIFPFYTCADEVLRINDTAFDGESILVAGNGDFGVKYHSLGKFNAYQRTYVIQNFSNETTTKYLYLVVSTQTHNFKKMAQGGIIKFLHLGQLQNLKIPLPPLATQKQIVERLDKIAEARKLNDELIQKSDELFQSLFYNEYEVKNNQWNSKKLQEVCKKIDQAHPKKMFKKEFSYIDIASINNDKVIRAQIVSVDKAPSRARKVVKAGDTIFSTVRPYLKHIAYIPEMLDNSIASTGFCVIRPNADLVNTLFLNYVVESNHFVRRVLPFQRGANYPAVSDKNVYDIKISLPPLETQKQIVAKLSAAQEYKTRLLAQKSKLKELFNSVLAKSIKW